MTSRILGPDGTSSEILNASLEYMRTPTPELNNEHYWATKFCSGDLWSSSNSSSPILSCPPSWLEPGNGYGYECSGTEFEDDASDPVLDVPLSSSPPDLKSSSPQSSLLDDASTSLTSLSSVQTPVPQANHSLVEPVSGDAFGRRLSGLLLIAIKERQRDLETGDTDTESSSDADSHRHSRNCSGYQSRQEWWNDLHEASLSPFEARCTNNRSHSSLRTASTLTYRIIKRAESHGASDCNEPAVKRQKLVRDQDTRARERIYAHRTASLRRADSLKSGAPPRAGSHDWLSTAPGTPAAATSTPNRRNVVTTSDYDKVLIDAVPIIAPPIGYVGNFPQSEETLAKTRLKRCMERELSGRENDGLPPGICLRPPLWMVKAALDEGIPLVHEENSWEDDVVVEWEVVLGIGKKRRHAAIKWLLDALPIKAPGRSSSPESPVSQSSWSPNSCFSSSTSSSQWTSNDSDSPENARPIYNLQDQLENSPQTRFHAVWMFIRYLYLTMSPDTKDHKDTHCGFSTLSRNNSVDQEGLNLIVWDVAVACLAISVKFHRDFLHPLLPVFADEYISLAPHLISPEDLESAHRDVLSAFDYRLGITPQPIMDELWLALPSLRNLLDFCGGWSAATSKAWKRLFTVLDEPDIQRFLVSVLTVVALMDSILESLLDHLHYEEALKESPTHCTISVPYAQDHRRKNLVETAKYEVEGVFCDIQALTGVTDVTVLECRLWMTGRKRNQEGTSMRCIMD